MHIGYINVCKYIIYIVCACTHIDCMSIYYARSMKFVAVAAGAAQRWGSNYMYYEKIMTTITTIKSWKRV